MRVGLYLMVAGSLLPFSDTLAQTVSGKVTEQVSGLAVRGVGVLLVDSTGRPRMAAMSDSAGSYRMIAPAAGLYSLTFRRAGLAPVEGVEIRLAAGIDKMVNATMMPGITTLATVDVVGKSSVDIPPGNRRKYDEFLRRKAVGLGTFLTREDLESRPRGQVQEIFNGIPGIKVRHNGAQWFLRSQRCPGSTIPGIDASVGGAQRKVDPMLFIDGVRVLDISALANISPSQIEAVEVYQGAAQLPAEARGDACFAVFVWLNNG